MIIDAHCHSDEYHEAGWIDPPELVLDLMDKAGVDISLITTYGEYPAYEQAADYLIRACKKYPGRLYGFLRINAAGGQRAVDFLEKTVRAYPEYIRGVKVHPVSNIMKAYNPMSIRLFRKCAELGIPVFSHCCDRVTAQPWQIHYGAVQCPETTFICHIGGFFHGEEAIRMAEQTPNLYLDTSSTPYPDLVRKAVETIGPDRVVFASDNPAGDPLVDVAKIQKLGFDKETYNKIMYRNIARLIRLDVDA